MQSPQKDIYDKSVEKKYYEICEKRGYFELDGNLNLQKIKAQKAHANTQKIGENSQIQGATSPQSGENSQNQSTNSKT